LPSPVQIFNDCLEDLGQQGAGQSAPNAEDTAKCVRHYNRLIDRWRALGRMSYFEFSQVFTFSVSQQAYTIGVAANNPDFVISGAGSGVRPVKINRAKLVLTAASPPSEIELPVIFKQIYESIPIPGQSGTQPFCVYYKPTFPNGTLYPVPYPTVTSNQLKLYFGSQLSTITIADIGTNIDMPPALEDALTYTLMERLCIAFQKPVPDQLRIEAHGARQVYSQLNDADPALIDTDIYGRSEIYDNQWFLTRGHN